MSFFDAGCIRFRARSLLALTFVCSLGFAGSASANICHVTLAGAGDHTGTTWGNAMTLREALPAACTETWVKAGTYTPVTPATPNAPTIAERKVSFHILPGSAIYGGFAGDESDRSARDPVAHVTTLSGEIGDANAVTDNSYHVVYVGGANATPITVSNTVLDGFTITGGYAFGDHGDHDDEGAGLYCDGSGAGHECSPALSNLVFVNNAADYRGGAVFNDGSASGTASPSLSNVGFSGNSAFNGGGICSLGENGGTSSPTLSGVTFSGNNSGNYGGAMYSMARLSGTSSASLSNVTFSGNNAVAGGAMFVAARSSGISNPTLSNVTFGDNSAEDNGAAMYNIGRDGAASSVTLSNVIVWDDPGSAPDPGEIFNDSITPVIDHSVIRGGCPAGANCGAGMITSDPLLGSLADNGGSTLTMLPGVGSSVIDAGTCPAPVGGPDQRGMPRPQGPQCDIGAVEVAVPAALTMTVVGSGSVSAAANPLRLSGGIANCTDSGGSCAADYAEHTGVTLTATLVSGQSLTWGGDCSGSAASISLTMTAAKACTATFANDTYTLNYTAGPHGSIIGGSSVQTVAYAGDGSAVTVEADSGYHFVGWSDTSTDNPRTDTNVTANISVVAYFDVDAYTVGGSVAGLVGGGAVTLQLNDGNSLPVDSNRDFTFPTSIISGGSYVASVLAQPAGQRCSINNAAGSITDHDVSDVLVTCEAAKPVLSLSVNDGHEYARYGMTLDYLVTITNSGNAPATNVTVSNTSLGLDMANAHWQCISAGGGATCTANGVGQFGDTVTVPAGDSLAWIVTAPVEPDAVGNDAAMRIAATGATTVTDTDTLVIFRDGFDVAYADGTQAVTPPLHGVAVLGSDSSDIFGLPPASGDGITTIRTLRDGDRAMQVQRLVLGNAGYVRLLRHLQSGEENASVWVRVAADAKLSVGSVAGKDGKRIVLLEGASKPLSLPLAH